jgi:hypothetical protein
LRPRCRQLCPASQDGGESPERWTGQVVTSVLGRRGKLLPFSHTTSCRSLRWTGWVAPAASRRQLKASRKPKVAHPSPTSRYLPWVRYCDVEIVDLGLHGAPARRLRSPSIWCSRYTPRHATVASALPGLGSRMLCEGSRVVRLPLLWDNMYLACVSRTARNASCCGERRALFSNSSARSSASHAQVSRRPA